MIEFNPMSEQECLEANMIPKGIHRFKVQNTVEKRSQKVGDFLSLKHQITLSDGKQRTIFDALFFTEQMMWKTRHFYRAANRMDIYDSKKIMAQDCDNLEGFLEVDHRPRKDTGEIEAYVKDYITPEAPPADEATFDDDIPPI